MTAATQPNGASDRALADASTPNGEPILVATDGTDFSRPALEAALELTARTRAHVHIVTVGRDLPVIPVDFGIVLAPPASAAAVRDSMLFRIKEQLVEVAGTGAEWPIEVRWGDAAVEIARAAADIGAGLIVLGVEHRTVVDRLLAHETALALLRLTRVPLLVVPTGFSAAPRRVTVATDFSHASLAAARLALGLYPTISNIDLVYVRPTRLAESTSGFTEWLAPVASTIELGFELAKAQLSGVRNASITTTTLRGHRANEIASFAHSTRADLLIMGSTGMGLLERFLIGSTSRQILRRAPCAALAVRATSERDGPFAILGPQREAIPVHLWKEQLDAFSQRNQGRLATIEVVGTLVGSKVQDRDVRFEGAAWDPYDERLEIMTGQAGASHHTRNIDNVRVVELLRDSIGRDWILRVTNGETQTILTFSRHHATTGG